jgi:hypothetical protein
MHLICRVVGHRINRKRVRLNGHTYSGRCRWCSTPMEKGPDGWQVKPPGSEEAG